MSAPIGLPWFHRDDYPDLRRMFTDGDRLPYIFDDWLQAATETYHQFQDLRLPVIQVLIQPDPFRAWCADKDLRPDYRARQQFSSEVARTSSHHDGHVLALCA
ncbi:MAG TPA: hypothetical protein VHL31_02205 [Geminicoccus sp.]|jgi:hypothetical protein|uniref:hypothetical protein n=1 Tax=Geminicoccus sp. TaxID=2024832 RepID=UPI002E377B38|nr:hypothetical protein [Geminicoccus sp.]HEX2525098.1 hypothetical protein [Geminicoccus sp.]